MYDPYDEWMIIDFNDNWEDFNGKITNGLYMVKTLDYSSMHGDNIYSSSILLKAQQNDIAFKIIKQLLQSKKVSNLLFKNILDDILKIADGDT